MIANYEFTANGITLAEDILKHSKGEKENFDCGDLRSNSLGYIIKDVFSDKVLKVSRGPRGSRKSCYQNLERKVRRSREGDLEEVTDKDKSDVASQLNSMKDRIPMNWTTVSDHPAHISFIRQESWEFNGQRGYTELAVTMEEDDIKFTSKSHGCSIELKNCLDFRSVLNSSSVVDKVLLALEFIDKSSACPGFHSVDGHDEVIALLPHVSGKFLDSTTGEEESRSFAEDCNMFAAPGVPCARCRHLQKTDRTRRKRKTEMETIHLKCNKRYLNRGEIQSQLSGEQKKRRKSEKRERYWREKYREECVEMEQEDHNDLNVMMEAIDEKNVPEDMACLWKQQRQLLHTQSKSGYRWHPK